MQLTKYGHACVRLDQDDRRLVIDPGGLTDPAALNGASAVLVTHEHFDHFSEPVLRAAATADPALEIWTNTAVAARLEGLGNRVHRVGEGDAFTAAGFEIQVYGAWHAVIHPDIPRITNIGFLVDGRVFHPGDALTVPDRPGLPGLEALLLPVHAPWSTIGHLVDYVREIAPHHAYAIHDGALNDTGTAMVGGLLGEHGPGIGAPYTRLTTGATVAVG
jgi:L-ascorbate metabolism protein UlaG (beta-lactamase superfamily)